MKYLSFDIGIKNLSFCLIDDTNLTIEDWGIINISPDELCEHCMKENKQCDKCQGDCDNDDGCKGSLKCFHRSKNGKEDVDGCQSGGRSADDRKNVGYCY